MEFSCDVSIVTIVSLTIANINICSCISLATRVVRGIDWSTIFGNTKGVSVGVLSHASVSVLHQCFDIRNTVSTSFVS